MNNGMRQFAWWVPPNEQHPEGKFRRGKKPMLNDEMMTAAAKHHKAHGCFQSVYEFPTWTGGRLTPDTSKLAEVNTIFLDLDDAENPQNAIRDAAEIVWYVGHSANFFSGKKGAHVLISCEPADLIPDLKSTVIRRFVNNLSDVLCEIDTLDYAVVGDLARVRRIPLTKHPDTGMYVIGLTAEELAMKTIDEIKEMANLRREVMIQRPTPSTWVTEQLYRIEEELLIERLGRLLDNRMISDRKYRDILTMLPTPEADRTMIFKFIGAVETEMQRIRMKKVANMPITPGGRTPEEAWLLKVVEIFRVVQRAANIQPAGSKVSTSSSEHEARCHLVNLAYKDCGWSFDKVCDIFSNADDYNQKITERMVRSLIKRR